MRIDIPEKYPKMFAQCFDFSTGPGWDSILDELCQKLQEISDTHGEQITVNQVKEKFGSLRFYVNNSISAQDKLIDAAETACDQTCEVCGEPGSARNTSWIKTLCDQHAK